MLSSSFDICEFIDKVKGNNGQKVIYLADREATEAERLVYKKARTDSLDNARTYTALLKDIVLYMRYGIRTHAVRQIDGAQLDDLGEFC